MILGFADKGLEDYQYWVQNDKKILKRINLLIQDIKETQMTLMVLENLKD